MFMRKYFILIILTAALALTACGSSTNNAAITGVIAHTHSMILPAGYVVIIRIDDTTKSDSPAEEIAEEMITSPGEQLPIPFAIVYDPEKIDPDHTYTIKVEIEDTTGKLEYTNVTSAPVITHGNPTRDVKVIVVLPNQ